MNMDGSLLLESTTPLEKTINKLLQALEGAGGK